MKKFSKIVLTVAAVAGIFGLGMTICGVAMGATFASLDISGSHFSKTLKNIVRNAEEDMEDSWIKNWDDIQELKAVKSDEEKDIYLDSDIWEMDISLSAAELELEQWDEDGMRIEVSGDKKEDVRIGREDDTLVIEGIGRDKDTYIKVLYPEDTKFDQVSIEVDAGTVVSNNELSMKELEVSVGAGEFLSEVLIAADEAEIEVGAGNVELGCLRTVNLEADCGVGNISLGIDGKEADYEYELSCAAGMIEIGNNSYNGLGQEQMIHNPDAVGEMSLECGVGNITINFND